MAKKEKYKSVGMAKDMCFRLGSRIKSTVDLLSSCSYS